MKLVMFILIFLFVGAFFIVNENALALKDSGNFQKFIDLYSKWLGKILSNGGNVVGYVIKLDWLPD